MTHEFEIRDEITLDATPDQVWDAIATGPGIDSWFMGHTEVDPREGGRGSFSVAGQTMRNTVTGWEPGKRFAFRGDDAPDGTFMAFEYLIEGREGGSSVLRFVHSGLLGDDWEAEYDALKEGDPMYLRKLAVYLKHFQGRTSAANMFLFGPLVNDTERVWSAFASALGLAGEIPEGAQVRVAIDGLAPVDGVVEFTSVPHFAAVRTAEGMYMFVEGQGMLVVEHHSYSDDVDGKEIESAWQSWMATTFA
jgi:uncharacterized protein YndB with AHSA1/START domain